MNANKQWMRLLLDIIEHGQEVVCRGHRIVEVMGKQSVIDMKYPLVNMVKRKLGYRFACAEAAWILSGDNKVETIKPFSKTISGFSNDAMFFYGAYGPKIVDQIEYIGRALLKDIFSRQAVINIWREKPSTEIKDIPCTVSVQFLVRMVDGKPTLFLFDSMRSSDTWLGVPYDWFTFSMLGAYFCLYFKQISNIELQLGNLLFSAASQHLYTNSYGYSLIEVKGVINDQTPAFDYAPLNPYEFSSPGELVEHLWSLAKTRKVLPGKNFLKELEQYWAN